MADNSGILDPNAPRGAGVSDSESQDTPTADELKLAKQIDKLFEKAAKHRKKYDSVWTDNYKMFRGQQWLKKRPVYKSKEVINLIFQTIQSQHSVMMDTRPTVGFLPSEPSDYELSEILNQVFQSDWERNNWMEELASIVLDGHIYSVGYGECCHEDDYYTDTGIACIRWYCKDPLDLYPDPEAVNVNKKAAWIIDAHPTDIETVKRKYAGHKYIALVKPDLEDMSYFQRTTSLETLHKRKNTDLNLPADQPYSINSLDEEKDKVLVVTAYMRPNDTEQLEKDDMDAEGEKLYITRLKYPQGRKIVKINGMIFEDGPLPYEHRQFPYQRYVNYLLPREFFGMSEVDHTKGPQMIFNRLVNFALDVLTMMGNPIWMVPLEANINTRKLINQPGLVVEYANGVKPVREEGVQLQPYVLQLIDRMEKWFNDEAGTQDVTRGVNPTGVTANAAIENLLEAAQKRIKQKMRNMDGLLKDFGRQWLGLAFQYYTAPQVFRLTNKDGSYKYFKFHVEHRPVVRNDGQPASDIMGEPKKQKFAIVRGYDTTSDGQQIPQESAKEYQINGDFDVKVNTISGLLTSKAQLEQQTFQLFDRGIIDAQEVLSKLDYPNAEAILQRMQQQAAQAAPPPGAGKAPAA